MADNFDIEAVVDQLLQLGQKEGWLLPTRFLNVEQLGKETQNILEAQASKGPEAAARHVTKLWFPIARALSERSQQKLVERVQDFIVEAKPKPKPAAAKVTKPPAKAAAPPKAAVPTRAPAKAVAPPPKAVAPPRKAVAPMPKAPPPKAAALPTPPPPRVPPAGRNLPARRESSSSEEGEISSSESSSE